MLQQPQHFDKNSPLRSSLRKHRFDSNGKQQQRSPSGRKNVSFCSSQNAENKKLLVSNVTDCFTLMQSGTELIKLRTNVRQFRRIFSLDEDMAYIRWTPSNKKPHKARISINSIKEVRVGWNSELLKLTEPIISPEINEECAFSIIHGDERECLDLIALNASDANIWITGLISLASGEVSSLIKEININGNLYLSPANLRERWLSLSFKEIDQDNKGYISEKSTVRLIRSLNNRLLISRIKQKVKEASNLINNNEMQRGKIDEVHFIDIYKDLATRPEIYFLMVRYANKDYLNTNDLQLFLETEQGLSGITKQFCENIIDQCEPSIEAKELNIMTVDGFTNFLNSQINSIFDSEHLNVCQNMEKHFSNYFISTSFNTYLVEDQLRGPSSLDGYISALKRNCRYIELDIWEPDDDSEIDEPVLFNGGTLTSKLLLSPVLDLINEMAFERTKFPLFIRLELHLFSIDWQHKLFNLLELKLGKHLYKPKLDQTDWTKEIPTPKKFLNKIILSGSFYEGNSPIGEIEEENESSDLLLFTRENTNLLQNEQKSKKRLMPLLKEIKDLIAPFAIFARINEIGDIDKFSPKSHIISISESDCIQFVHLQPNYLFSSSSSSNNRLIRVFPSHQRIDSSNLNPQEFWNFGCQFVALNYQTPGLMMDLQEGKFLANGNCGYVLKPSIMIKEEEENNNNIINSFNNLLNDEQKINNNNNQNIKKIISLNNNKQLLINNNNNSQQQILHLKIISAQQLPRPRASTAKGDTGLDPFVVLEVFGIPADCAEERTKTVRSSDDDNCFNPTFDESFQFNVSVPELALIRFLVLDDDFIGDDFIGQYTIPFDCLQSGYRHIPLLNNEGEQLESSTLFVHIAITNKRGGGKPKKRGLSVKRKTSRTQTGIKIVGIKQIDELFKSASGPLSQFIELKNGIESSMFIWSDECGIDILKGNNNIGQSLIKLHSRAIKEGLIITNNLPIFTINRRINNFIEILQLNIQNITNISDSLQKAFTALDNLLKQCSDINLKSNSLYISLNESSKLISEFELNLQQIAAEAGLKGQKATRAQENYAWNVRLLKAQIVLMQETFSDAKQVLEQITESSRVLGILIEDEENEKEEKK